MNKLHTYFGQVVTNDELNELFNTVAGALEQFILDFGFSGLSAGGSVGQNSSPNLSVMVVGPTVVYDQLANRILIPTVNVPVTLDENNQPTAVVNAGNEKWLSIFAKFVSTPTDPRVDEAGDPLFYRDVAGYQLRVAQGSEAAVGTAPRPALRGDQILLADVRLIANQTTVLNADVSVTRTQTIYDVPGTPLQMKGKRIQDAIASIVAALNAMNTNTLIVPAISGSPVSLSSGSVTAVITALLNALNGQPAALGLAKLAPDQTFAGQNTFTAKTTINQNEFHDQLFQIVTDASRALRSCGSTPGDDAVAGNKWKGIDELKWGSTAGGGQYLRTYTGIDGTDNGVFAIVNNCTWNKTVGVQRWEKRDTALPATALLFTFNRVRVSVVPIGTDNWTAWPINMPGGLDANWAGLHVVGDGVFNGKVTASGFELEPDQTMTDTVYLTNVLGSAVWNSILSVWGADPYPGSALVPLRIPRGMTAGSLRIAFYQDTNSAAQFKLVKRTIDYVAHVHGVSIDDGGGSYPSVLGDTSGVNKHQFATLNLSSFTFDPAEEYFIQWIPSSASDYLKGMRLIGSVVKTVPLGLVGT